MATVKDCIVATALDVANNDIHGYTNSYPQNQWWRGNDMDCGSFGSYSLHKALLQINVDTGYDYYEPMGNKTPWNEAFLLKYCNRYNYEDIRNEPGDILTSNGHTVIVTSVNPDCITHAANDYDGVSGDSSGQEIRTQRLYDGGWNYIYRLKDEYNKTIGIRDGIQDSAGEDGRWGYYVDGKIDTSINTVTPNAYGWWYVKDGYVDFTYNGLAQNDYGWWVIQGGKVNFNAPAGLYSNEWGDWYCTGGNVRFDVNDVVFDEMDGVWKYIRGGKWIKDYSGIAYNNNGLWRIVNGTVDFTDGDYTIKIRVKNGGVATNPAEQG